VRALRPLLGARRGVASRSEAQRGPRRDGAPDLCARSVLALKMRAPARRIWAPPVSYGDAQFKDSSSQTRPAAQSSSLPHGSPTARSVSGAQNPSPNSAKSWWTQIKPAAH
jgi:hypothetical protein